MSTTSVFAENLTLNVSEKGGAAKISDLAGVSRQMLKRYMSGDAEPRLNVLLRLVEALDTDVLTLCSSASTIKSPGKLSSLPYLEGNLIPQHLATTHKVYADRIDGCLALSPECYHQQLRNVSTDDLRLFYVDSDAMSPLLKAGNIAIISCMPDHLIGGEGVYLLHNDNNIIIRRLQYVSQSECFAMSDNQSYEKFKFLPGREYSIVGKVLMALNAM